MIRTPPQHQTDPNKTPGQVKTLGDYLKQKEKAYMTSDEAFEEWADKMVSVTSDPYFISQAAWYAAIEWYKSQQNPLENYHGT